MGDVKLWTCFWELRNGLKTVGKPYTTDGLTQWNSTFGEDAYWVCVDSGSNNPLCDIKVIEDEAKKRGLNLNCSSKEYLGSRPIEIVYDEEEETLEDEMIEI